MEKPRSTQLESPSYMELRLDFDGRQGALFLRVPTFFDAVKKQWIGAIKLSDGKIISAVGKNSFDLQNAFNVIMSEYMQKEMYATEIFDMFKPLECWERK